MTDPAPTAHGKVPWRLTPEFLLGLFFAADGMAAPGLGIPISYVAVFALIIVGVSRKAQFKLDRWGWVGVLLVLLLAYVAMLSSLAHPTTYASSWVRRAIRLVGIVLLVLHLATGRLNARVLINGAVLGLLVNVGAFYLKIAPDNYGGALTGWLADKNRAGLFYATFGLLGLVAFRRSFARFVIVALFAGLLWLTESRMSMTALGAGLIWTFLIAARPLLVRWLSAYGLWSLVAYLESNFAQAGVFENRWGSDLLRGRIDAASDLKLAATPWFGMGLGEAYVVLQDNTWYFHNSYSTLLVEGGWPYLIGILIVTILVGLRPFSAGQRSFDGRVAAGATVVVLLCAWKLGEVFLTIPWGVTVGYALNAMLAQQQVPEPEPAPAMSQTP